MKLDAVQCRMARAALGLGVRDLAEIADVSPNTIARLERGEKLHARTQAFIRGALEAEGVTIIDHGTPSGAGGQGVRLGRGQSRYSELFEAFWGLPDLRREPRAALDALTHVFGTYLDIIDSERREPDTWERLDLNDALHALANDNPHMAFALLRRGITPPDNQSPDYPIPTDLAAATSKVDLAHLRGTLAAITDRREHQRASG